eukprot:Hpha_TRINITY_DN3615_c0_g2::TRINITY_DN3615_c0_g2_i1::g.995::m.995
MPDTLRVQLERFYNKHNPDKVGEVDRVLKLATDSGIATDELFQSLCAKYKVPYDPRDWQEGPAVAPGAVRGAAIKVVGGAPAPAPAPAPAAPPASGGYRYAAVSGGAGGGGGGG